MVGGGLVAAMLLAACSGDAVSGPDAVARLSGGSSTGGGGGGGGGGSTSTGGGSTSTGGGGGGGGGKTCTNTLSINATGTESLAGNSFSATYVVTSCFSKKQVSMKATDMATGFVVWQSVPDLAGTIAIWSLPYTLTTYRVDARAINGNDGTIIATASQLVDMTNPLPCTPFIHETATVGYWGLYAALWAAQDAQDCGQGGTVHLVITNLNTGLVELDYPNLSLSNMIDFEGPQVKYSTPYRVRAELWSRSGTLIDASETDVVTSPMK
jgi:hypothetical protein